MNLRVKIVRIDRGTPPPGSFIDAEYVMHVVFAGSFWFQSERDVYSIGPGDVILMPPNTLHALRRIEGIHMMVVHFVDLSHELDVRGYRQVISLAPDDTDFVRRLSEALSRDWQRNDGSSSVICEGLLHSIVGIFLENNERNGKEVDGRARFKSWKTIAAAVQIIRERRSDPNLTVREISGEVGMSYNYFCALFHSYTNETPLHFLNRMRIESAKELMFNRRHNATEAGLASGFRSLYYFSRVFRRYEGLPPKRWLAETRSRG